MKTKLLKSLKFLAGASFLFALALNIIVTLDDPFMFMSDVAIATGTETGTGPETGTGTGTGTGTITLPGQICMGTLCNNLLPEIKTVWKNIVTGTISVQPISVDMGWWWNNIGYDRICKAGQMVEWCDISTQGRTIYQ